MRSKIDTEKRLRSLLEELIVSLKKSSDPFKIDIEWYIKELRELFPSIDIDNLDIDSEIIYVLTDVVKKQKEWLKNKSFLFLLGSLIALVKIAGMNSKELAEELVRVWNPIVSLEQVTFNDLLKGINYVSSKKKLFLDDVLREVQEQVGNKNLIVKDFIRRNELEQYINKVKQRLSKLFIDNDVVEYNDVINANNLKEKYMLALALSYLVKEGKFSLYYDALDEKIFVIKNIESDKNGYESIVTKIV